jgi:hypothetical protein
MPTPHMKLHCHNLLVFAKFSEFVMPDLIRHPEFSGVTGFRSSPVEDPDAFFGE